MCFATPYDSILARRMSRVTLIWVLKYSGSTSDATHARVFSPCLVWHIIERCHMKNSALAEINGSEDAEVSKVAGGGCRWWTWQLWSEAILQPWMLPASDGVTKKVVRFQNFGLCILVYQGLVKIKFDWKTTI